MKKLVVDFDEGTGNVFVGGCLVCMLGGPSLEYAKTQQEKSISVSDLIELKKAGYATDDIVQLKREGLV